MKQLSLKPDIYEYETFEQFAREFKLGKKDLIITNEYIYEPFMKKLSLVCSKLFQEKFGLGEPTDIMVQAIIDEVKKIDCDRIIAVGGGTVIDIAKILVVDGVSDVYEMYDKVDELTKEKGLIIVPTTCGTGSEVSNISVVNLTRLHIKKGLCSDKMYADSAILISEFMNSLPHGVFATSSIDALIHATESFLTPKATPFTEIFAKKAIEEIILGYKDIAEHGTERRFANGGKFLRASTLAGISFSNVGCGIVHAMSYALGGKYHVPHGESNYQFFTAVLRFYDKKNPDGKLGELKTLIRLILCDDDAFAALDRLLNAILPLKRMRDYGAVKEDIAVFAKNTVDNQQRLLVGCYVPTSLEEIEQLFEERL